MSDAPKSGPRRIAEHRIVWVKVRVELTTTCPDADIDTLCAVDSLMSGLDVPGATVLRASAEPMGSVAPVCGRPMLEET